MATKAELLALVEQTIAGQGNQVDIGGGLAEVLKGLVEAMPEELTILSATAVSNKTKAELAEALGISTDSIDKIFGGKISKVIIKVTASSFVYLDFTCGDSNIVTFGYRETNQELGLCCEFTKNDDEYGYTYYEW